MRPSILLSFWRLHKCRRDVLAALQPFVAHGSPATGWDDPAALGFLMTLITHVAERSAGPLASDALGNLQSETWGVLTGLPSEPVGERVVGLSAAADPSFVEGSRRALLFSQALDAADATIPEVAADGFTEGGAVLSVAERDLTLLELWESLLSDSAPT